MQPVETILGNKPLLRKAILLEYVKTPDGIPVKEIEKRLGVSGLDKNHLTKLEEFGILEIHHIKVRRPAGRFKTETMCMDKGYRLKQDPETLHILVTKAVDHDRDSQTVFMRSPYYHSMIPVLRDRVCKLMHLSEMEAYTLKSALSTNWLALKFVDHFISEEDERTDILRYLAHSTNSPMISPAAARAAGFKNGFCDGLNASRPFIIDTGRMVTMVSVDGKKSTCFDDVLRSSYEPWNVVGKRIDDRTVELVKPPINWTEFFTQLTDLNENYRYLFD